MSGPSPVMCLLLLCASAANAELFGSMADFAKAHAADGKTYVSFDTSLSGGVLSASSATDNIVDGRPVVLNQGTPNNAAYWRVCQDTASKKYYFKNVQYNCYMGMGMRMMMKEIPSTPLPDVFTFFPTWGNSRRGSSWGIPVNQPSYEPVWTNDLLTCQSLFIGESVRWDMSWKQIVAVSGADHTMRSASMPVNGAKGKCISEVKTSGGSVLSTPPTKCPTAVFVNVRGYDTSGSC